MKPGNKSKSSKSNPTIESIDKWVKKIKLDPSFTEADAEELKTHLLDLMDELKDAGLSEKEAFRIASRRLGNINEIEHEYRQENLDIIQTRRSAIVLSGVLIYFFSFHLIGSLTKLFFVILSYNDLSGPLLISWMNRFLIVGHLIFVFLFTSILLSEKKIMAFIEKIKIHPKHAFIILITTLIIGIFNVWILTNAKRVIGDDLILRGRFLYTFIIYEYSFPFLFCLGFILIYYKYYRKVKI